MKINSYDFLVNDELAFVTLQWVGLMVATKVTKYSEHEYLSSFPALSNVSSLLGFQVFGEKNKNQLT